MSEKDFNLDELYNGIDINELRQMCTKQIQIENRGINIDSDEKTINELEKYIPILDVRLELEEIAKKAIDKHLIQSWYYNGKTFVVIFKDQAGSNIR